MATKKQNNEFNQKKEQIKSNISGKLRRYYARSVEKATPEQIYKACAFTVRDELMEEWAKSREILMTYEEWIKFKENL